MILIVILGCLLVTSFSYSSLSSISLRKTYLAALPNSYQNLLQEAQSRKLQQQPNNIQSSTTTYASPPAMLIPPPAKISKQAWTPAPEPKTVRERASFKSKVPFNEEMYEILRTTIEILSDRIKSKAPITSEQAVWLQDAVELIIADAQQYGPPPRPVQTSE